MGMTILQAKQKLHESWMLLTTCGRDTELTQALSIAETVLGNYDDALKADKVAMLTEIHDDSKNIRSTMLNCDCFHEGIMAYDKLIQQKINELKKED